jgi:hypothetical protein
MLSTANLSTMPDIDPLRLHMQRLAALNAVFSVDMGEPQFGFDPKWGKNQQLATNINGGGDELYLHFTSRGCFIKGFAHESEMTPYKRADKSLWPGVVEGVPLEFQGSLREPAFDPEATTFVVWRLTTDAAWSTGKVEFPPGDYKDGSADLLEPITFTAERFAEWLSENYETEVDEEIVAAVFAGRPLTDEQLKSLNPEAKVREIRAAVIETGYPVEAK